MTTVTIGGDSRPLADADPQWIAEQVNGRQRDGQTVCVQVNVQELDAHIPLSTPTCGGGFGGGGGGRMPNSLERRILDAWNNHDLNTAEFTTGELIAFIHALERLL